MSIIVQCDQSADLTHDTPVAPCPVETEGILEMGPGLDHDPDVPVMSEEDNSIIDLSSSNIRRNSVKENRTSVAHCGLGSYFGLPYQDHNYGAPPPPTPPSFSPPHQSPVRINNIVDEDTNLSVISTSTVNEETHEGSITRCICDYDHDDEYMICCDKCLVWQHVDCMGLDRNNIPDTYMCEKCEPRRIDKQKAKILQARKRVALTDTSDESDEDSTTMCKSKSKHTRRRKEDDRPEKKNEHINCCKKNKTTLKNHKERLEFKRAKLRKRTKSKSDGTSTADEEAQDAWECSLEWFEKYEHAETNQYTPAVQHLAATLQNHEDEQRFLEQLQVQLCRVCEFSACQKCVVSDCELQRDQILIEYRGRYLTASQFHNQHPVFSKRLFPFVLFYKLDSDAGLCIDATEYGNDARFIRRSCKPNAEVQHVVLNGSIHLFISATKDISKGEEITIPFDFSSKECIRDIECACEDENCLFSCKKNGIMDSSIEKKRRSKRTSFTEEDSSQSLPGVVSSPSKSCKSAPLKLSTYDSQQVSISVSSATENSESKMQSDEQESEECVTKNRRKMTREERKIDAIMRAFDQMEKAAKRRKQALDRIAQQKSQHGKSDEHNEKLDSVSGVAKEEEKPVAISSTEVVCVDDDKSAVVVLANQTIKQKKGKRRRGSGTPSRRRTRTNSGGSDILSPDEMLTATNVLQCPVTSLSVPSDISLSEITSPSSSTTTHNSAPSPGLPPTPVIPKIKRFLMQGLHQEKVESSVPVSCPLSIHTEVSWNVNATVPTCYVRCTKDSPSAGGISAAHLRRSSTSSQSKQSSGQGSAKKRWLKQAMYECGSCDAMSDDRSADHNHPVLHNGCLSPGFHIEINSLCVSPHEDVQTPLKKRRLMRESIESLSSPKSPSTPLAASEWLATSSESPENSCSGPSVEETFPPVVLASVNSSSSENVCHVSENNTVEEESSVKVCNENGLEPHLSSTSKISENKFLKADKHIETDAHASSPGPKYDNMAEQSHNIGSTHHPSHSVDVSSGKSKFTDAKDSLNVTCLDLSQKADSSGESDLNRTKNETATERGNSHEVSSGRSLSPSPSEEMCDGSHSRTDFVVKNTNAQTTGLGILNNCNANQRKLHLPDKDDGLQEPSSTTVDCVSSTSCSSVNNNSCFKHVTSSELQPVQSCVSSSCPADESALTDVVVPPLSVPVSSSTVPYELPSRSVEPETSPKSIVSSSVPPTASLKVSTPSLTLPLVSSSAPRYSESSKSTTGTVVSNASCRADVSSSGAFPVPSSGEPPNASTSTSGGSGVSSTTVSCDNSKQQDLENKQLCKSGTQGSLNRRSSVQEVSAAGSSTSPGLSSSQKRKVSLSEYRKRMRHHTGESSAPRTKESNSSSGSSFKTEVLSSHPVELPKLPLFESSSFSHGTDQQHSKQVDNQAVKKQDVECPADEQQLSRKYMENTKRPRDLTQRLKCEFGLDDNSDHEERSGSIEKSHKTSVSPSALALVPGSPSVAPNQPLCPQPPLPPPCRNRTTPTPQQFNHPMKPTYSQQSGVVSQVSASPFTTTSQPSGASTTVLPNQCPVTTPLASHPLIQSPHSYSTSTHASTSRPSQTTYPTPVNTHGFSVQQPPPPPPPPPHQGFRRVFKPALYK